MVLADRIKLFEERRRDFMEAHCQKLKVWFDKQGNFVAPGTEPATRERLWNCFSLLSHGSDESLELADAIIMKTIIDKNHFEAIAAVDLLLQYEPVLTHKAVAHLKNIVAQHIVLMLDVTWGCPGINNFSCMGTYLILGAAQVLDRYCFEHPLASDPAVYNGARLQVAGMNRLQGLAYCVEHQDLIDEYNSPTYTPLSLMAMAKIVKWISHPSAQAMALQVEQKIWHEVLSMYHRDLNLSSGPYSRSYRIDMVGQRSSMRKLFSCLGISTDQSIAEMLTPTCKNDLFHHKHDIPFGWSSVAWYLAAEYHLPESALTELEERTYPYSFAANIKWNEFGEIDSKTRQWQSVQGNVLPAGKGQVHLLQNENWSLGYLTRTTYGHSFPIYLQYAIKTPVQTMRDIRSVTVGTILRNKPEEWVTSGTGDLVESNNFDHAGDLKIKATDSNTLVFEGSPLSQLASIATDELSINMFIPIHYSQPQAVWLNDQKWNGQAWEIQDNQIVCQVEDGHLTYRIQWVFNRAISIRFEPWSHYWRLAAYWYEGEPCYFDESTYQKEQVQGKVELLSTFNSDVGNASFQRQTIEI